MVSAVKTTGDKFVSDFLSCTAMYKNRLNIKLNKGIMLLLVGMLAFHAKADATDTKVDLSTPEEAVAAHYRGFRDNNFELFKVVHKDASWLTKKNLEKAGQQFKGFTITKKEFINQDDEDSKSGDVYIRTEERFGDEITYMHFLLRKGMTGWTIVSFNLDAESTK